MRSGCGWKQLFVPNSEHMTWANCSFELIYATSTSDCSCIFYALLPKQLPPF